MSETLSPQKIAYYQELLNIREQVRAQSRNSYDKQHQLEAGSRDRDAQGANTNNLWDELGKITKELVDAGILNGYGNLTDEAIRLGLTQ